MKKLLSKVLPSLLLAALALSALSGFALADTVIASDGTAYIRNQPSLGATTVGTLYEGDQAWFLDEIVTDYLGIRWYYVSYQGATGWAPAGEVDLLTSLPDSNGRCVYAANGKSFIRSAPSTDANDLGSFPKDCYARYLNEYSIDRNGRYWYKIQYNGIVGWVSARYTVLL